MNDNGKIGAAKQGLLEFAGLLGNNDGLGLTTFSDDITVQTPVQQLGPNRQNIISQMNAIEAGGNTRLYDAIDGQVKALSTLQSKHIKVVVVLTDGMDDASNITIGRLINDIKTSGKDAGNGIKVFTIAYGSDADFSDLAKISSATGGQGYTGSIENIRQVYYDISQFF
jgi:Ca-activated chloride channel family protein